MGNKMRVTIALGSYWEGKDGGKGREREEERERERKRRGEGVNEMEKG